MAPFVGTNRILDDRVFCQLLENHPSIYEFVALEADLKPMEDTET